MVKAHIEELTEITTIVKELSSWQIFKEIILHDYQRRLLPVVEIEASKRRRDAENSKKVRCNVAGVTDNKVFQKVFEVMADTMDMNMALDMLRTNIEKCVERPPDNWEDGMRAKIDQFILEYLPNFDSGSDDSDKKSNIQSNPFGIQDALVNNSDQLLINGSRNGGVQVITELGSRQRENGLSGSLPLAGNHDASISRLSTKKIDRQ